MVISNSSGGREVTERQDMRALRVMVRAPTVCLRIMGANCTIDIGWYSRENLRGNVAHTYTLDCTYA